MTAVVCRQMSIITQIRKTSQVRVHFDWNSSNGMGTGPNMHEMLPIITEQFDN